MPPAPKPSPTPSLPPSPPLPSNPDFWCLRLAAVSVLTWLEWIALVWMVVYFDSSGLAFSTAAEHLLESRKKMGNIAIFTDSLSTLQALNSADPDQMIQGLHSSLAKLTVQFTVSLQWVPAHVGLTGSKKADRLAKIGSQAPQTQNPVTYREAKTLLHSRYSGDWKKQNGGYQAHLDLIWRPLSSACTQGIVVWAPIWRGLAFQTLPCVSADKLTKPQITSFSPAQSMPRDVS